ncbi:hypothetical protein WJX72_010638 [[Myrmecia] bisecta]|uniref:NmrA-like domain-containing protein n=1 Tax=[Myrmecia] bisecta TaxID=41462 RepID=A0AAW1PX64_9CHLO
MSRDPELFCLGCKKDGQGGSVVKALRQSTPKFVIKAITRDIDSPIALQLALAGITVLEADLADKGALVEAFRGADGLFLVTDFFGGARCDARLEIEHGINAIEAAKEFTENPGEVVDEGAFQETQRGFIIPQFESKSAIAEHLKKSGLPYTILLTSFFFEDFLTTPNLEFPDGRYGFLANVAADAVLPGLAVADVGSAAARAFLYPLRCIGKCIPVVGDYFRFPDALATMSTVTGKRFEYVQVTNKQFWHMQTHGARELSNAYRMQSYHV